MDKNYDVIVVGAGASGCTVARELSKTGKKVLMIERGKRIESIGNSLAMARMVKNYGLTMSEEKNSVVFAQTYGGASNLTAGCAMPPTPAMFGSWGIDLSAEAEEAKKEMGIGLMPDELVGNANLRLLEAAHDAGFAWQKLNKFIDPQKCVENCGDCMLGCKRGAKWTARIFGDEALANGADLLLEAKVDRVMVENHKAVGVEGMLKGKPFQYHGKAVVLSAGLADAFILREAGIKNAGVGLACDWLQFVGGIIPGMNTAKVSPMAVGTLEHYETDGVILTQAFPTFSQFGLGALSLGPSFLLKIPDFWKYTGVMVKICDEVTGEMISDARFSKPVTRQDRQRLNKGIEIIKKILTRAGADEKSFITLHPNGAHPCASCRIGDVVDHNLETEIQNLYCCDASVLPTSLGKPLVWILVSLSKRLAGHLRKF
jgi:choline dehydrogenase-like flavoprotein